MKEEILVAKDIDQKDHSAPRSEFNFRISVYGILIEDGKILLQKSPFSSYFTLPGGGIKIGESESAALIREFQEETGYSITPQKIVDSGFNLFTYDNKFFHNLFIFYEIKKTSDHTGPITDSEEVGGQVQFFDLKALDINIINPIHQSIIKKYQ
jgi:8-oxo-dGTP pyrophosphatase MutT (NUDIX family)